jgi:hypothetical protein
MENFCVSDLVPLSVDQVKSEVVPGPVAGYQEALFTLPPNRIYSLDPLDNRWISIISSDEYSNEDESQKD